jgi:L-ascorbate metabolism protein UlaG (beta-lactamase superfamily)
MKIQWFAHAAFLIETGHLRIITDPYTPEVMGFSPIITRADVVIRSSRDDAGHCFASMIPGDPVVVTATEIGSEPFEVAGVRITAIPAQESLIHKAQPADNAMYRFSLEGLEMVHMGDVGNRLTESQLKALGGADVLFAPVGGPPTIELSDLYEAIQILKPRITIPMHYRLDGTKVKMLPVTEFTRLFPKDTVQWITESVIEVTAGRLPIESKIVVLEPSTAGLCG